MIASSPKNGLPLYVKVLIGVAVGIGLGVTFGDQPYLFGKSNKDFGAIGMLVIRMLKTLATPLIFVSILDSFLKTSISAKSGLRLGAVCLTNVSVAMIIGLSLLNGLAPGESWQGQMDQLGLAVGAQASTNTVTATLDPLKNLAGFIPENIIDPFAKNLVISVVLMGILSGAALRHVRDHVPELKDAMVPVSHLIEVAANVLTTMLLWVANLMPYAVALIVGDVVGKAGIEVFRILWTFLAVILGGLLLHTLLYYPLLGWVVGGYTPLRYFRGSLDAVITGLSCNSSLATMPVTLRCLRDLGVRERAARLSACVGTNFNNDGIMLYEAMATLFLCQAMGYDLSLSQQLTVVAGSIMAGVGIAGIPEAGLIILPLVLGVAGVPEAAIAIAVPLIVPVDWIIARVRSGVNVMADIVVAMVLDRFEGD